jgi:polyhydroxybutyrate depolymerase
MVRIGSLALLALLSSGCAAQAGDPEMTLQVGGVTRSYVLHLPTPRPTAPLPVVLAFHGGGGQGRRMAGLTGLDPLADRRGFIVAYPDGIDRHWNDGRSTIKRKTDDVGFVAALLDEFERSYKIDRARVYATGISNGAMFSERLGCDLAGRIAAIAPVAGTMPVDIADTCRPSAPVSVLQIGGTADPIMPFDGGAVADFGGLGEGGVVLSDVRSAALWAGLDRCPAPAAPTVLPPAAEPDGTSVTRTIWAPCAGGARVVQLTIQGGGHTWPDGPQYLPKFIVGPVSHQLDATSAIVDFFLATPGHQGSRNPITRIPGTTR